MGRRAEYNINEEQREVRDTVEDLEFAMANTGIFTDPRFMEACELIQTLEPSDRRLFLVYAHFDCKPVKTARYFNVDVRTVNTRLMYIMEKLNKK